MDTKLTKEEITAFVGKNADYYYKRWAPLIEGQDWTGFNWAPFFFSGFWLPYRKMYQTAFGFYGCIFLATVIEEISSDHGTPQNQTLWHILRLTAAIICGAYGNRWYFNHAKDVIAQVRSKQLPDNVFMNELSKRGGTSIVAGVGFFVVFAVALSAIAFLMRA